MKKLFSLILVILLCFSLFACTKDKEEEKPIDNNNTTNNTNNTDKPEPTNTGFSGVYYSHSSEAYEPYFPQFIFTNDGKFTFVENVYAGMIENTGTYTINDKQIDCILTENNMKGFLGEDVKEITFVKDGDDLIIMTNICMTKKLDIFSTEKKQEADHSGEITEYNFEETCYKSTSDLAVEGYEPLLILGSDYTFVFSENTFHGMTDLKGVYEMDNWGNITCYVENPDDPSYSILVFKKVEDHYEIQSDIILTRTNDQFYFYGADSN